MMNKKKNTCKCIIFIIIALLLFGALSEGMKGNELNGTCSIKGFYQEDKNSLDAVVIGASEAYTSYSPTKAWKEYGYTSYDMASPGIGGNLYKTMLAEVLKTQTPDVVAIEINGFIHGDDYLYREGKVRNVVDNLKWSRNRLDAIHEIVPEEKWMSFYFPIAAYHSGWTTPINFMKNIVMKAIICLTGTSNMKGVSTCSRVYQAECQKSEGHFQYTEKDKKSLDELLDYCRKQGLENVVFFRTPHATVAENQELLDEVWAEIESYGYDVLDGSSMLDEIGIDIRNDFYDKEHLNVYGMEKFTSYLGNYFCQQYGLAGNHSETVCAKWDRCAQKAEEVFGECKEAIAEGKPRYFNEAEVYFDIRKYPVQEE